MSINKQIRFGNALLTQEIFMEANQLIDNALKIN